MAVTLQQILRDHFDDFQQSHPLADYQRQAARRIIDCRTAALGGHVLACPHGHFYRIAYNSCRHRSCPQCAALERERWLADWKERLLACPHYHIIFTVSHDLIPVWRYNKRVFPGILFRAAADSLRELLADEKYLGAEPGMVASLHTWDQKLGEHPHSHFLLSAGGLDPLGHWREPKKECLLPRRVLMEVFRGKMRDYLLKALEKGELTLPPDTSVTQLKNLLNKLGRVDWNVKILDRYDHGRGVLVYLARYLKGGPISNERLVDCRDGKVRFRYRDRADVDPAERAGRRKTLPLDVDTFLSRVLEHVPPPNYQTVRGYGLYANSKRDDLAVARQHFGQTPKSEKAKLTWQDLCEQLGLAEQTVCPECGERLILHSRFAPGRGPPAELVACLDRAA